MESSLTLSEITLAVQRIQYQLDNIRDILNNIEKEDSNFLLQAKKTDELVRKLNVDEMNTHGHSSTEIVNWYWENYDHTAILVVTPNGDHPIDFNEWTEGRIKNNKEALPEYYKDFMVRVIDKGGYIQVLPF